MAGCGMQLEGAERAGVVEDDASPVIEADRRTREPRELVFDSIEVPIASHPEMRVQNAPVVQHQELMLAAAFDRSNGRASQRQETRSGNSPPERRVVQLDSRDVLSDSGATEATHGALDFR